MKKRFKFLVYPKFQLTLIIANIFVMLISFSAILFQLDRFYKKMSFMGQEAKITQNHTFFRFLEFQKSSMYSYLLIALIIGILFSLLITFFLSHKMAGPLIRIKSHFENLETKEKFEPINTRKGDFLKELPDAINKALVK